MRKEPFTVGDYVHVFNRGNRKLPIVRDEKDRWRFLQMLYYFNTQTPIENPFRQLNRLLRSNLNQQLTWPEVWPSRKPIVKILCFALVENHFHLLLKEIQDGGITLFMRKLGTGMTSYSNTRYQEVGRLFQGSYKAKLISEDTYLQYLSVYIQVKNPFELYPGGPQKGIQEFDKAFQWATQYPYCSLGEYASKRSSPITEKDLLEEFFPTPKSYKDFARRCVTRLNLEDTLGSLTLEA